LTTAFQAKKQPKPIFLFFLDLPDLPTYLFPVNGSKKDQRELQSYFNVLQEHFSNLMSPIQKGNEKDNFEDFWIRISCQETFYW